MIRLAVACFCTALCAAALAQGNIMSNKAVYERIAAHWKETYPEEKILKIEDLRTIQSSYMYRHGSIEVKEARVTVERTGNQRARFRTTVHFRARMGMPWQFEHVHVERPAP